MILPVSLLHCPSCTAALLAPLVPSFFRPPVLSGPPRLLSAGVGEWQLAPTGLPKVGVLQGHWSDVRGLKLQEEAMAKKRLRGVFSFTATPTRDDGATGPGRRSGKMNRR